MKRKVSICIIFCAVVLSAAGMAFLPGRKQPEETQMTELASEVQETEPAVAANTDNTAVYLYVIKDCDGRVVVYRTETMEVYMETGIRSDQLPEEIRNRLGSGIGFADEESLFDFLESYSS